MTSANKAMQALHIHLVGFGNAATRRMDGGFDIRTLLWDIGRSRRNLPFPPV
jgi:hypothetical protein